MFEAVDGLWSKVAEVYEEAARIAWEATEPEYRDRLLVVRDPFSPRAEIVWADNTARLEVEPPIFACWVFAEVAHCVARLWPDCGSIPCGFPCAGGPVVP